MYTRTYVRAHTHTRVRTHSMALELKSLFSLSERKQARNIEIWGFYGGDNTKGHCVWYVLPCGLLETYRRVREKSLNFHKTTRRQDSLLMCSISIIKVVKSDGAC